MVLAKLDVYETIILPGTIMIKIESTNDPTLLDVFTELSNTDGMIFLEGSKYQYLNDYQIVKDGDTLYLSLDVVLST